MTIPIQYYTIPVEVSLDCKSLMFLSTLVDLMFLRFHMFSANSRWMKTNVTASGRKIARNRAVYTETALLLSTMHKALLYV